LLSCILSRKGSEISGGWSALRDVEIQGAILDHFTFSWMM
jgi:hypothetical protein